MGGNNSSFLVMLFWFYAKSKKKALKKYPFLPQSVCFDMYFYKKNNHCFPS